MLDIRKPELAELPSLARLRRATVVAAVGAVLILVAVVLPAEYGIDPSGAGPVLGLTEMGEIRRELQLEAEQDEDPCSNPYLVYSLAQPTPTRAGGTRRY